MNIELNGDNLTINIIDLLSSLSHEQEQQLIESLSCSDSVIKHVADQIAHGSTENGHSGWESGSATATTPLSIAIRECAKSSSDLAKKEIESLERNLKSAADGERLYMDKFYALRNKHNDYSQD